MTQQKAVLLILCLMFLPISVVAQGPEVKEGVMHKEGGGETREGVLASLKKYLGAFEAKDLDGVMAIFADAPNTVMMGTGTDEIWLGKDDIRRAHNAFLDNFEKESSEQAIVSVGASGNIAWLVGYITVTRLESENSETFQVNLSIVFEQIESTWYITAMHFSNLTSEQ